MCSRSPAHPFVPERLFRNGRRVQAPSRRASATHTEAVVWPFHRSHALTPSWRGPRHVQTLNVALTGAYRPADAYKCARPRPECNFGSSGLYDMISILHRPRMAACKRWDTVYIASPSWLEGVTRRCAWSGRAVACCRAPLSLDLFPFAAQGASPVAVPVSKGGTHTAPASPTALHHARLYEEAGHLPAHSGVEPKRVVLSKRTQGWCGVWRLEERRDSRQLLGSVHRSGVVRRELNPGRRVCGGHFPCNSDSTS
jgi:hypothetical protein